MAVNQERMYFRAEMTQWGSCFLIFHMPHFSMAIKWFRSLLYYNITMFISCYGYLVFSPTDSSKFGCREFLLIVHSRPFNRLSCSSLAGKSTWDPRETVVYPLWSCPQTILFVLQKSLLKISLHRPSELLSQQLSHHFSEHFIWIIQFLLPNFKKCRWPSLESQVLILNFRTAFR